MAEKKILDWNQYLEMAAKVVAEGCILLKNDNEALPLEKGSNVAVFGRIQNHYYKSGTGSGGMVNVSKVTNIVDGLRESGCVNVNEKLFQIYQAWEEESPYEEGQGWGTEPWSQKEMPLTDEVVSEAAGESGQAIVIIGRTAGEDQDVRLEKGSFLLTDLETDMLQKVRKAFDKMTVLLNVGGIMDMHFIDEIKPDAVMYVWQGGMTGGTGTADVLVGKVSPSGKLTDTIAYEISDYASDQNFGDEDRNFYKEDIYVGYRYFETFAPEKVRFPFGFGLSYTTFQLKENRTEVLLEKRLAKFSITVENTGKYPGKEVVQVYGNPPQGKLGKAVRNLLAFQKTQVLHPGDVQCLNFEISLDELASYDDAGITGHKSCFVLEAGEYEILAGTCVRCAEPVCKLTLAEDVVIEELEEALAPVLPFEVMKPVEMDGAVEGASGVIEGEGGAGKADTCTVSKAKYKVSMVPAKTAEIDMEERRKAELPAELPVTGDKGIKLKDVLDGKAAMEDFVAQMSDDELCSMVRGEGMGSSRVTPGTASAFGGVSKALTEKGIPAVCCDDGPSGMRLDCGTKAFSLPNGTLIASTFNPEIVTQLYEFTGLEMAKNKVECLLGPGMNIHRHPLNGRNFEYFSEDPYLTGTMAVAMLQGLHNSGVTGTIKHFCGNNQEKRRHFTDSVISERALREIYLKGFEMAVKKGGAYTVMTTYGSVNGLWTAGLYDLTTTILRKEWGFEGVAMTDWWAKISERDKEPDFTNFAAMVRAQNDLYMCCPDGETNASGDNTLEALQEGRLTRGELQRVAMNVCGAAMKTRAMKRLLDTEEEIEIINKEPDANDVDTSQVEFVLLEDDIQIPLDNVPSVKDTNYLFAFDVKKTGVYKVTVKGRSSLGELAQLPCTLYFNGFPMKVFTFHGSGGEFMELDCEVDLMTRFSTLRLSVGRNGLELLDITYKYLRPSERRP